MATGGSLCHGGGMIRLSMSRLFGPGLWGLLSLILLAGCETVPELDCSLTKVAQMPLRVEDRLLVVPVGINGKWAHLVVDSGAERSTIGSASADRLGLPHDARFKTTSMGIGGATSATDVSIDRLVLGETYFQEVKRLAVGSFDLQNPGGLNADGLLGADILLAFDMDIDVPGGKLTLYRSRLCPSVQPPWEEPSIEIQGVRALKDRLLVPIDLDGTAGMAILDTGAQGNVVGVNMARRMGLTEQVLAVDPPVRNRGVGGIAIARLHRFHQLKIGPVIEESPAITVLPSDFGVGDALIGETFLQGRRVWISFHNRAVFVSKRSYER
jgi:predicted aspartyl protease